jgi:hexosaminidase
MDTSRYHKESLLLLPRPRHLALSGETCSLPPHILILVDSTNVQASWFAATELQRALQTYGGVRGEVVAGTAVPLDGVGATVSIIPHSISHPQGYEVTVTTERIHVVAATAAGAFYAVQTLKQLLQQHGRRLPALRCRDWPDFANRGFLLDISRDKVPTMATLYELVDLLAAWKINQLQLYTEHTFAYRNHPTVWKEASPLTGAEIVALDAYCRRRFVELVPNQNSFGHMRRWLIHDAYRPLAECPDGCNTVWGYFDEPFTLCPGDPGSLGLVRSLYNELLPHFSSRQFNVGCDETVDLGRGRSQADVAARGEGPVYLDFLLQIHREVKARGFTMQFWGDVMMNHPELVPSLPRDLIALEWGYEADHPFDEHGAIFAASGIPFYVCPGTSTWNAIAGRSHNGLANLRNAAVNGRKHGATGYLNTNWGDNGHWEPLPVSYLGLAGGAAYGWAFEANETLDLAEAVSVHAFRDATGVMGRLAYDLGNAYLETGYDTFNGTIFFSILQSEPEQVVSRLAAGPDRPSQATDLEAHWQDVLVHIEAVTAPLAGEPTMERPDASLVQREFRWVSQMLRHACRRAIWLLGRHHDREDDNLRRQLLAECDTLLAEHDAIWHARNRPGGFQDSQARLRRVRESYGVSTQREPE